MTPRRWTVGLSLLNQRNAGSGTERFESRVGFRLVRHGDPWRWIVYTRGFLPSEWQGSEGFEEIVCAPARQVRGGRLWSEQVSWPWALRRDPPDILLTLAFAPPLASRLPAVMAVHDVTPLERPNDYTPRSRWYWEQALLRAAPRARRLLVPSLWSRERCAEVLRIDPQRIDVVLTGVEPVFFEERRGETVAAVRSRYGVDGPYWLHCGVAHPRKNLETAIRAIAILRQRGDDVPRLVRVGGTGPYLDRLRAVARDLGVLDCFLDLGAVENADLAALYAGCDAFVFPSWEEGFGVPPLEAMASGADVLASHSSCLPEILGDTPFWADPAQPESWVEAWNACRALSQAERAERRTRAKQWASRYTWDDVAARCLRSLERAVAELT